MEGTTRTETTVLAHHLGQLEELMTEIVRTCRNSVIVKESALAQQDLVHNKITLLASGSKKCMIATWHRKRERDVTETESERGKENNKIVIVIENSSSGKEKTNANEICENVSSARGEVHKRQQERENENVKFWTYNHS